MSLDLVLSCWVVCLEFVLYDDTLYVCSTCANVTRLGDLELIDSLLHENEIYGQHVLVVTVLVQSRDTRL